MGKSVQAVGAGELQVSVVEGRNFAVKEMGRGTLDSCVELLLGDEKVRTETVRDSLSPSWLADFNLSVPSEDSHLWVSVLDEDQFFGREVLIGRAVVAIKELIGCGKRVVCIHVKNLDNINVGEIVLVLRYTSYQSSATEERESNPLGLKALLSSSEATSSESMKYITDPDGQLWRSVEVLKDVQVGEILPPLTQTEGSEQTGPSLSASAEISNSAEIASDQEVKHDSVKGGDEGPSVKTRSYAGQYKMLAFTGAMVTILVAFVVGNNQKKKSQDPHQMKKEKELSVEDRIAWTLF
ncbi:hypothetical protein MPTK1_2g11810 [Marchantia polymorpha subsp. ruderalis]|uniref:C2 domain-containing protein n=1 Tax=Marchantia polymorpha TaxID=3197 RepID=A0A2R6XCL4_MARPO|nr:hypothetical protein MARPO_0023s0146 [Marchantia polymorpha]PTQ43851.1 hypothetical protein MARPO_0023s0146 [Marchantia polymorpha]BBN01988.1 hypothetical protein Mp_2g11810 [Marchantia polymorpha subsp. ruderalis]BBN01989.1 hypothetical protein Mp_2g11810 [Marchantia polymorpha subsp. ruderalis]|eukprot:PTQ43850.1 hypothetical protein MARPO_0023s0146 [Marchantia polymorpha]